MNPEQQTEHNVRCMERALAHLATGLVPTRTLRNDSERGWWVPSASGGPAHRTRVHLQASHVLVHCDCQAEGRWGGWPGVTPCWHGAAACAAETAAERICFDGSRWVPVDQPTPEPQADDDPFKGLPR